MVSVEDAPYYCGGLNQVFGRSQLYGELVDLTFKDIPGRHSFIKC